jgi:CheY-like chemotaxis protein
MNRRVLLIDADTAFRDTLTRELGRFRVVVMTEPDAERAIAIAASDAPALIVIAVEEPEKAGFRVFQKCKKGALAKVPLILVTASVAAESFAKHRGLKVHADEYLDKRQMSTDELVGKIDNLIALGEPEPDDLALPVEDDIPMEIADGDVVLDETVNEEAGNEFAHEARTVGPGEGAMQVDAMVGAETDAAFDALLGDDAPAPAEPGARDDRDEVSVVKGIPEVVPDPMARPEPEDGAPMPIHDSAMAEVEQSYSHIGAPIDAETVAAESAADEHDHPRSKRQSIDSIPLSDEELEPFEEDDVQSGGPTHERPGSEPAVISAGLPNDQVTVARAPLLQHEAPTVAREPIITDIAKPPAVARTTTKPRFVESATTLDTVKEPSASQSGSHPSIDLGLDAIAGEAERDQSGVYDRRALRKIGELERQITQLKAEIERTRTAAESATKGAGREKEFLNLRETIAAKDKEVRQIKDELAAKAKEAAAAAEQARQAQHAKTALETKNSELEQRILDQGGKQSETEATAKAAAAQIATLKQELDAKTRALGTAEAAKDALEHDLASERELRQSSAGEAERALRAEREQLVKRHQSDLERAVADAEAAQAGRLAAAHDAALAELRAELETAHQAAVADAVAEVEAARQAAIADKDQTVAALERKHVQDTVNLKAEQAEQMTRVRTDLGGELKQAKAALAAAEAAHAAAVAEAEAAQADALAAAASERATALEQLAQRHAGELEAKDQEHAEALERVSTEQGAALADLKTTLDRTGAGYEQKLASARKELEDLIAEAEAHKGQLHEQSRAALAQQKDEHDAELAKLHEDRAQLADAAKRTAEAHRAAIAEAQARFDAELAQVREAAEREATEHKAAAAAARRMAEEAAAQLEHERAAAAEQHASAIAGLEAKHERAIAVANGEHLKHKSIADAEHGRAIAAMTAQHEQALAAAAADAGKALRDLAAERDEISRGLSSARDGLKRSEHELASAVQTLADRNADLRSHGLAIAERDQRIAELRKEIEALEQENASYQEQVLRAYQKIKTDEAMVARARKAMAIALTVLDDEGNPTSS